MNATFLAGALATGATFASLCAGVALAQGPGSTPVYLSEIIIDPSGTDNGVEYVEIRSAANTSLSGYYLVMIEGDGAAAGTVDKVDAFDASWSTGSNGLLLWRDAASVHNPAPAAGTSVVVRDFNPDIENGSNTYLLGYGTPPTINSDLDADNDGTLNAGALTGFTVVDAVTLLESDTGANVGYADDLGFPVVGPITTPASYTPDWLERVFNADGTPCNWVGGDLTGTAAAGFFVRTDRVGWGYAAHGIDNTQFPTLAWTPGNANYAPDADADGAMNACDGCTDTDGDGLGNGGFPANTCGLDACPGDPANADSDGDGALDCNDQCPNDPLKTQVGECGCGVPDTDTDGDTRPDCNDLCPNDPLKTAPGACGCGVADVDTDEDGTADCNDLCPNDPLKTAPGACGCGVAESDTDSDGTADCNDLCPNDPLKTAPGACGCGVAETDTDSDGTPDCNDLCPNDPL
ncbi:MAG: hypothetical protein RL112_241, partial [Planctomycetota bacterium]